MNHPLVSIVIPTYKRPDLLPRAVDSALAQTYRNVEVVVSDDEKPAGPSWEYLQRRAREDARLRPVQHTGPGGQERNMNHALAHAQGAWIKPLHDDDLMLPRCVERFMAYCRGRDHVALASCMSAAVNGDRRREVRLGVSSPHAELIRQKYLHLGMYLNDPLVGGPPTTLFLNRRAVDAGGRMVVDSPIRYFADALWKAEIVRHGDCVMVPELLVEYHQGEHASLSSEFRHKPEDLDEEVRALRVLLYEMIPPELNPPPLETALQSSFIFRGLSDLKAFRFRRAAALMMSARRPTAWVLAVRVAAFRSLGLRWFRTCPREPLREALAD